MRPQDRAAAARTVRSVLLGNPRMPDMLPRIALPTTYVSGADDPMYPPALVEPVVRTLPGVRFVVAASTGHLTALERPVVVADELFRLASRIDRENPVAAE